MLPSALPWSLRASEGADGVRRARVGELSLQWFELAVIWASG